MRNQKSIYKIMLGLVGLAGVASLACAACCLPVIGVIAAGLGMTSIGIAMNGWYLAAGILFPIALVFALWRLKASTPCVISSCSNHCLVSSEEGKPHE